MGLLELVYPSVDTLYNINITIVNRFFERIKFILYKDYNNGRIVSVSTTSDSILR